MSKSGERPPFLAFATDLADINTLKAFATSQQWPDSGIHQGDIKTAATYLKSNPSPLLLLVEIPSAAEAPALLDALADVCEPDTKVITIGSINEYSFFCWLMDLGIFSYLLRPLTETMLSAAYLKSSEPPSSQNKQGKPPGKVIAVMGTRGGVGATTLSLNLAGILAAESPKKNIGLVDFDPHEGSLALSLDIEPSRGLRDALEKPDRIDSLFIDRVMSKPFKNLSVLSAEEALHDRVNIHANAGDTMIKELRDKFDVVVIDIPRYLNAFSKAALKQADHVLLVTELTLLSLRDVLRVGDVFRETMKAKAPIVVASRVGIAPKHEMQAADFEKGINAKITHKIGYAPEMFMHIGTDIPAIKHKSNPAFKPLYALAAQLVPDVKGKAATPAGKKFSLFKKKTTG
jgi:pilus assembly protein CpaE